MLNLIVEMRLKKLSPPNINKPFLFSKDYFSFYLQAVLQVKCHNWLLSIKQGFRSYFYLQFGDLVTTRNGEKAFIKSCPSLSLRNRDFRDSNNFVSHSEYSNN